jgi:hypothetical protein
MIQEKSVFLEKTYFSVKLYYGRRIKVSVVGWLLEKGVNFCQV